MKRHLYHGTSSRFMETINKEGLIPFIDLTYGNGITNKFPVVYLTESQLSAKLYAYNRCYGSEIREFMNKKYKLPQTPAKMSRMVFFPSEGGEPQIAIVNIEIREIREGEHSFVSPMWKEAQPFSDDHNTKEYMVFRPIERNEIVEIIPVKEKLNELCKRILKEANPKAIEEAAELKKQTIETMKSFGYAVDGHNMFEITEMIADSPEIDEYLENVKKKVKV